jgi:ribosomal protein L27
MTGGKARPKKDKSIKISNGMAVNAGQILARGIPTYKAGLNVGGRETLFAFCPGKIYFTKKKTSHGRPRTFINVSPIAKKESR